MKPVVPRGLYAIADTAWLPPERFRERIAAILAGGACMIQYRDKSDDAARRLHEARILVELCSAAGALAIINDDVALAAASEAHGVHLGADDDSPRRARARLGDAALIGVSCYDRLARARAARAAGADYVAFGRAYPSRTKPGGPRATLELLRRARTQIGLPVCAIGGITPERVRPLVEAGVDLVAVIAGLFETDDIRARTAAFVRAFAEAEGDRTTDHPRPNTD